MKQKIQIILYRNNVSSFSNNLKINKVHQFEETKKQKKFENKQCTSKTNGLHKNERITFERSKTHIFV